MKKGEILYAKKGSTYVFKYIGDVRYTMCPPLNQFVTELYERDDLRAVSYTHLTLPTNREV